MYIRTEPKIFFWNFKQHYPLHVSKSMTVHVKRHKFSSYTYLDINSQELFQKFYFMVSFIPWRSADAFLVNFSIYVYSSIDI